MKSLSDVLTEKGFPVGLPANGEIHRFDMHGNNTGWFKAHKIVLSSGKKILVARFGDWKSGEDHFFKDEGEYNEHEQKEITQAESELRRQVEAARKELQQQTAKRAAEFWNTLRHGQILHPYLRAKGLEGKVQGRIGSFPLTDTKEVPDCLIVSIEDIDGNITSLQGITNDGTKMLMRGGRVRGCFHRIGWDDSKFDTVLVCEGFATGQSLHLATCLPVVCAMFAGNLAPVALEIRMRYPQIEIIICGDDDRFTVVNGIPTNTGRLKAQEAASQIAGKLAFPKFSSDEGQPTDFNDMHQREGLDAVREWFSVSPPTPKEDKPTKLPIYQAFRCFQERYKYKMLGNSKQCFVWNGTHYEEMGDQYIKNFALETVDAGKKRGKTVREDFLDLIHITNLTPPSWFDETTNRHMNFKNGVLNIDTGTIVPHDSCRGFRHVLDYDYNPQATCPTYDKMMKDVTCGEKELELILDEFMGYCLSYDEYWIHKVLILTGDGENGKSTWMDTLKSLAGHGNYTPYFMRDLSNPNNIQALDGKLFNVAAEAPKKSFADNSVFKAMAAGEEVAARKLYRNPYSFRLRAKLIMACNELPDTEDTTRGFMRRFVIVPFRATFNHQREGFDPFIRQKLDAEKSGIVNRAIEGYKRLKAQKGFSGAKGVEEVHTQYRMDNDSVFRWAKEGLKWTPEYKEHDPKAPFLAFQEIYGAYVLDTEAGHRKPLTDIDFARKMSRIIPDYNNRSKLKKVDGKVVRGLFGVSRGEVTGDF